MNLYPRQCCFDLFFESVVSVFVFAGLLQPGVVLQFNEGTKFDIYGTLIAQGNLDELIVFEATIPLQLHILSFH